MSKKSPTKTETEMPTSSPFQSSLAIRQQWADFARPDIRVEPEWLRSSARIEPGPFQSMIDLKSEGKQKF